MSNGAIPTGFTPVDRGKKEAKLPSKRFAFTAKELRKLASKHSLGTLSLRTYKPNKADISKRGSCIKSSILISSRKKDHKREKGCQLWKG
ncbi:unnamed protein product [marine sediment metagenome]|uniref:Uncharacterized protein n=1 Tax=marine sediment metagenome TaxID=412755 RepID=X1P7A9_9ZZZZ